MNVGYRALWQRDSASHAGPATQRERASTSVASHAVMMVAPVHHSITLASVTGRPCLASEKRLSPGALSYSQGLREEDVR